MIDGASAPRPVELSIAGARLIADPDGALYWPVERALVLADLHLEKGVAFAARGVPLPPYDTDGTLDIVERLVARHRPALVIALGDSFHCADSHLHLPGLVRRRIAALTAARDWVWVAGNHDPEPPAGLGGMWMAEIVLGPLVFRHEPRPGSVLGEVAGHLHPVAKVVVRGSALRRRCFAASTERVVMPALGAYAGGLNVLDPVFSAVFPQSRFHAWMLGQRRVYPLAAARLAADPAPPAVRRAV